MKDNEQIQRRATWRKIVDGYLASDMTQKSFCEQVTRKSDAAFTIAYSIFYTNI
ncbi:MAG: hypothetical protein WAW86_08335 [Gammaproteobacteria bacterium]